MSAIETITFVHQFALENVTGVTCTIAELMKLIPRFAPRFTTNYFSFDNREKSKILINGLQEKSDKTACIVGINLHVEHRWEQTLAVLKMCEFTATPFLLYVHDYWPKNRNAVRFITETFGAKLLASTEFVCDDLRRDGFKPILAKIGVPLTNMASCDASPHWNSNLIPSIASVGRFVPRKRFVDIVKAFCYGKLYKNALLYLKLLPSVVNSQAVDQKQFAQLEEAFRKGEAPPDKVRVERRPSDRQDYSGYAIYVAASRYEGFGMTPIEAAYSGCPPILSDIRPHRTTADTLFGSSAKKFLYPTGNYVALAHLLEDELRSGWRRNFIADRLEQIRSYVDEHWSLKCTARELLSIIG